jgi:hypothetical protein
MPGPRRSRKEFTIFACGGAVTARKKRSTGPIPRTEGSLAVGEALKKYGIKDAVIAGGHGTTAKQADNAAALGLEVSSR